MNSYLIAQEPPPAAKEAAKDAQNPLGMLGNPMFMFLIIGVFIFTMIIMPARRQKKDQATMMTALKRGAKVVTSSGIIGVVVSVKDTEDELTLKSEDSKIKVLKSSVVRVLGQDETETKV